MPKFVVTKTFEVIINADTLENAKTMANHFLELQQTALIINNILSEQVTSIEVYKEPIEVAYTGWEVLIRQGIDEWKFEYEFGTLQVNVDGDLYHLNKILPTYHDFVEYAKTFVKENPNA